MMPLTTVACQPRPLNTKYSPYFAATYFRGQAFEARTVDPTRTASPQIVIHDDDALETQRAVRLRDRSRLMGSIQHRHFSPSDRTSQWSCGGWGIAHPRLLVVRWARRPFSMGN